MIRAQPVLIELIGPPGSGKTTIFGRLSGILRETTPSYLSVEEFERLELEIGERSIVKRRLWRRAGLLLPLFWQHPGVAMSILGLALLHGPPFLRRWKKAQRSLAHFLFALRLQQHDPASVIVLHDGFTQTLWSLLIDSRGLRGRGLVRSALAHYHAVLGQRGIQLLIDDQSAKARVFDRESRGRFNRRSSAARREHFMRWLGYHRELVAMLPAGVIAGTVDAARPADEVASAIAGIVGELARASCRSPAQAMPLPEASGASGYDGAGSTRAPSGPSS